MRSRHAAVTQEAAGKMGESLGLKTVALKERMAAAAHGTQRERCHSAHRTPRSTVLQEDLGKDTDVVLATEHL